MNWFEMLKSFIGFIIPFVYALIVNKFPQFADLFGNAQEMVEFFLTLISWLYSGAKASKSLYIAQNRLLKSDASIRTVNGANIVPK